MTKSLQSGFTKDSLVIPSVDLSIPMPGDAFPSSANVEGAQEILVEYDTATDRVIVTPQEVPKGTTVRFKDPKGRRLRIVFLSAVGDEVDTVLDSEVCTLTVGGAYHFKCFLTPPGAKSEISPNGAGVIDVIPHRP